MKPIYTFLLSCGMLFPLTGCESDAPEAAPATSVTLSLDVSEDHWTYVSVERGTIVGTSPLDDAAADAEWKTRNDWDIAFCGDKVRTNGGTSGNGEGALQLSDLPYDQVREAPAGGYVADSIVEVW